MGFVKNERQYHWSKTKQVAQGVKPRLWGVADLDQNLGNTKPSFAEDQRPTTIMNIIFQKNLKTCPIIEQASNLQCCTHRGASKETKKKKKKKIKGNLLLETIIDKLQSTTAQKNPKSQYEPGCQAALGDARAIPPTQRPRTRWLRCIDSQAQFQWVEKLGLGD
ncbi:hypothetical protein PAAG_05726 [Paracoccidioides lutzii Pb01]|uniref:Uncharacterized protein n=1 Tax=Paracoccidioides lutzii (strain ATCC MYA-826 / Pb01) TaxID=502779 RepID=C1H4N3_PARBA|nr:hypothetical protein PAAG_05726 [Paracoccidioides lutzii Pb01]EEH34677.2 hypothetical protein PAAG_05726 [Paracoccidioides lutzii Pb01]